MGKTQKIITTSLWAAVVLGMLAFVATRAMRGQPRTEAAASARAFTTLYDVPNFALTDQNSKSLSDKDLVDKVWIADFIFTNCAGPCPLMSRKLADLQPQLRSPEIKLVSFSVDPERDTPAVLNEYANRYGADESRWSFLTGTPEQMQEVFHGMNVAAKKENDNTVTHSTQFLLVDRGGHVVGIYRLNDEDAMKQLADDANLLASKSASKPK